MFRWFLACISSNLRIEVGRDAPVVIGRAPDARIVIAPDDDSASRYHAACQLLADVLTVRDLGSRNGTFVNQLQVQTAPLRPGDRLRVGRRVFEIQREEYELEETVPPPPAAPTWASDTAPAFTYRCCSCNAEGHPPGRFHGAPLDAWICPPCAEMRRTSPETWPERVRPQIGDWQLLRFLGHGGMSVVFEARHRTEGLLAALKLMRPMTSLGEMARKRFLREQRVLLALHHPAIVRAFEAAEDQGELFIASELVPEGEAESVASPVSPMNVIFLLAADLFSALAYAHGQGVVHRDVKPGNLLLTRASDGRLRGKLNDFGLAKSFHDVGGSYRTADDEVAGTPQFMAPEQALGLATAGVSADIYSAAATVYWLLTRELPFLAPDGHRLTGFAPLCIATLTYDRHPLRARRPEVPVDVASWLDLLLCREPERRAHVTAQMVAQRFAAISSG